MFYSLNFFNYFGNREGLFFLRINSLRFREVEWVFRFIKVLSGGVGIEI